MNTTLLSQVAWIGEAYVSGPIRGIVLCFSGLGATSMKDGPEAMELEWGQAGALVVLPYHNPWAWMNQATVTFTDELVSGLRAHYDLSEQTPIIATGGSMGGHGALAYTFLSQHSVSACAANCPVCDLPFHYTERADLPRTMHSAFGSYSDISDLLIAHSPLHQAAQMPDVPYLLIHGENDRAVSKAAHSDKLAAAFKERGLSVDYREQPGMGHCGPLDWTLYRRLTDFVLENLR